MLQTMQSMLRLSLSTDLPLFRLLTMFLRFPVCAAFQPFHKLIFHHQFTPADPQSWKIWAVQKVICARLGNLQCFRKLLCVHHIGHGFKRLFAHKILLFCMKKQPRFLVTAPMHTIHFYRLPAAVIFLLMFFCTSNNHIMQSITINQINHEILIFGKCDCITGKVRGCNQTSLIHFIRCLHSI